MHVCTFVHVDDFPEGETCTRYKHCTRARACTWARFEHERALQRLGPVREHPPFGGTTDVHARTCNLEGRRPL